MVIIKLTAIFGQSMIWSIIQILAAANSTEGDWFRNSGWKLLSAIGQLVLKISFGGLNHSRTFFLQHSDHQGQEIGFVLVVVLVVDYFKK